MLKQAEDLGIPTAFHVGETIYPDTMPTTYLKVSPADNIREVLKYNNTAHIVHGIALGHMGPSIVDKWLKEGKPVIAATISNNLLGYVQSATFHHACFLVNRNVPVALSHDDAPVFSVKHDITHDFIYLFYSCINCKARGMSLMKKLAETSIRASFCDPEKKKILLSDWHKRWTSWIAKTARTFILSENSSYKLLAPVIRTCSIVQRKRG